MPGFQASLDGTPSPTRIGIGFTGPMKPVGWIDVNTSGSAGTSRGRRRAEFGFAIAACA